MGLRWPFASVLILLQSKTTMGTLVQKEREPRLHLAWTHRKHPSYATLSCISQLPLWLALDLCHMWIYIPPLTARGQCHPFQFLLVHAPAVEFCRDSMSGEAAAGFRVISVKMFESKKKKKKRKCPPTLQTKGLRRRLTDIPVGKK